MVSTEQEQFTNVDADVTKPHLLLDEVEEGAVIVEPNPVNVDPEAKGELICKRRGDGESYVATLRRSWGVMAVCYL